ncbi:small ribosomal subunit protein mS25 isoform X2 [Pan paniscus]|uniref:small ribosomal subunit protein mS25 isoform X2 n=1 Tax=Pan paniscus TaxID=9597 RepID=UPI00155F728A|nr:28S ribosomal protein S25, mitochondrial isoform X2 [Pan paniscus]
MPMKGRFPIRRTLQYLSQGNVVFKDSVKVMTVNYNTHGELGEGARKFVFFNIPQIQYKNPWVQIMMFKNMTPSPFLRFYLEMGSYYFAQAGLEHLGSSDPRAFASQGVYRPCGNGGRDWSDAAASKQGMPRTAGTHQKVGRGKEGHSPRTLREHGPADTLISDFWPPEGWENKFLLF